MNDKDTVVVPELLPCPFCGGSAATDVDREELDIARALCTVCGADGPYEVLADHASEAKAVAKAAERWNNRAAAPSTSVREEDARVAALVGEIEAGRFDALEAGADQWLESAGVKRMANAIASVFEKYAPQDVMDRFREKVADLMHLAFVEGAAQGVLQLRYPAALKPSTDKGGEE